MAPPASISEMFGESDAQTFLGLPGCTDLDALQAKTAIFGAPIVTPYRRVGSYCHDAPTAIRKGIAGYGANLDHFDFDLGRPIFGEGPPTAVDCGDLACSEDDYAANRQLVRATASKILSAGAVPILLGGDDSAPIPFFEAFAGRGDYVIVQVDAHIDWREEVDGERNGLSSNMRRASEMPHIKEIIQVGQRALGSARPSDVEDARRWGVQFFSSRDIALSGLAPVLDTVPEGANVLFALDIDGLDPSVVPGVIGRAPGGLTYWQTAELLHGIAAKAKLCGFNLVEFMPDNDVDGLGALVCARLVVNVLGLVHAQS